VAPDRAWQQEPDHILELDPEDGPQQVVGDGQRQAAGDSRHDRENNKVNKKEIKGDIPPSPPQYPTNPRRKRGRQSTPKHPLPVDFSVTPAMRTWAAERTPHVDLDFETEKLVMWAKAKGAWRSDWTATWRLWMLNAAKSGSQGQRRAGSTPERHAGIRTWVDQKRKDLGASS
jgi:hypothetical protein